MPDIELTLTGPGAESAARELAAALGIEEPRTHPIEDPLAPVSRAIPAALLIAGAGLVLKLPSPVLQVMDIADRLNKRSKAAALLEAAERVRGEQGVEVTADTAAGPMPLTELDADALLELASRLAEAD